MEIIVSMTILTVVMAGLLNFFISAKKQTHYSRSRVTAAELGRYFLDPLQMQVRQDQWGSNCLSAGCSNAGCLGLGGCPSAQTINNIPFSPAYCFDCCCPYPVPSGCTETHACSYITGTTLKRVRVVISWSEY